MLWQEYGLAFDDAAPEDLLHMAEWYNARQQHEARNG